MRGERRQLEKESKEMDEKKEKVISELTMIDVATSLSFLINQIK
jgi:hypothetical protein